VWLERLATELISIPSFSGQEHAASDWTERQFRSMGLSVARLPVPDSADTVVARLDGPEQDGLLLSFHIDIEETAPNWKTDPFRPRVDEGRIYGAGAHDMKAGSAGLLAALEAFVRERPKLRAPLVVAATTDEMRWSRGAHAVIRSGLLRGCRYALIGEPSPEQTFHNGGRGRHILMVPYSDWIEATLRSAPLIREGERLTFRRQGDELMLNAYVLPGRGADDLVGAVRRAIGEVPIRVDPRPTPAPPSYLLLETSRIVQAMRKHVPKTSLAQNVCDANHFYAACGIEPVIYGPTGGNTDEAEEYLEIESLVHVSSVYLDVIRQMVGSKN
jgi:acetylornithine deacetylase/succinyl-diaminopimelate desuccinylase-like protein